MKDKQITKLYNKALSLNNDLSAKLQELASVASVILGYDVVADLCHGAEIEFRRIMDDGVPDTNSCILFEDILDILAQKGE